MHYIINIGSNKGDRRLNLSRVLASIAQTFGEFEMSHAVVSEPWGFESTSKFLNACLMFVSEKNPHEVLDELQRIEKKICPDSHRDADGKYIDRVIDIDIVAIDGMVIDTNRLKVPHPQLANRKFFLEPLAEIAPGWRHPVTGKTAEDMLNDIECHKE
ncbi:MAG: 2-amino-4-hydroxy-6-hydroxymethyldihydropteridine diphosphokinase [Prevotella sp.]|nr:2-amino-4-hydroxy-6-hydroxymethyldihydropteridine diphosphokinase [Bacteroides sp.]MCM1366041.1 2-amino-4-hydroxy-6-hydroxymethyldihydropteridine diphosphokinase [Prevotella sp.]MCM1436889.1 2-amino-4-hydroxy-6-hydroxymethyldihydropteridine diphosphokinase [Prevotella sp.]